MSVQSAIKKIDDILLGVAPFAKDFTLVTFGQIKEIIVELGKDEVKLEDAIDTEKGLISMIEGIERRVVELEKMKEEIERCDAVIKNAMDECSINKQPSKILIDRKVVIRAMQKMAVCDDYFKYRELFDAMKDIVGSAFGIDK